MYIFDPHGFVLEFLNQEKDIVTLHVTRFSRNRRGRTRRGLQHLYICSIILANRKFDLDESSKLQSWRK